MEQYRSCIDACLRCAAICNYCASSCTKEEHVKMLVRCIQLDFECATICYVTAQMMSLGSAKAIDLCQVCADICIVCAYECGKQDTVHCKACAKVCHECAEECRKIAA